MLLRLLFTLLILNLMACKQPNSNANQIKGATSKVHSKSEVQELPLDSCIQHYRKELNSELTAKKLCSCFMPQASSLLQESKIYAYMNEDWNQLSDEQILMLHQIYESCFETGMLKDQTEFMGYTPEVVEMLKTQIQTGFEQAGLGEDYDLNLLTDCLVEVLQQHYTVGEVLSGQVMDSEGFQALQDSCSLAASK